MTVPKLGFFKIHDDVEDITFATAGSACFDLRVYAKGGVTLAPGERAMIPTGLILDIPKGWNVKVYIRSSIALKRGVSLSNAIGVIDSDYYDELFIAVINHHSHPVSFAHGERIAQAELAKSPTIKLVEVKKAPVQTTERTGGIGSTGEK